MTISLANVAVDRKNTPVLSDVSLHVNAGEVVAVQGQSGSGKSTLLNVVSGLLAVRSGTVEVAGTRVNEMGDRARSTFRLKNVGMLRQDGDLIPELTLQENVELPLRLLGESKRDATNAATAQLEKFGILALASRYVDEVSGGQRQRAALARAVVHRPMVLLADEPTSALDDMNAAVAIEALLETARNLQAPTLIATHNADLMLRCDRVVRVIEGVVIESATETDFSR